MHSSRMRTGRSLTICLSLGGEGGKGSPQRNPKKIQKEKSKKKSKKKFQKSKKKIGGR